MITLPHGESNVTLACQNRCVSCNHFVAAQRPWMADPAVIARDLEMAAKVMHFRVYNMVGGEPSLHPQVVEIARLIRASGICDRVEMTSNGQSCERWDDNLYAALDDLIVTPYKLTDAQRSLIIDKCAEYGVALQWHPVIFTYAGYKQADRARGEALYRHCWYKRNRNVIDAGYFYRCCIGRFIPELLQGREQTYGALPLEGLTEQRLRAYLDEPTAPEMCDVCGSNCAPALPWREERDPAKWMEASLYG